MNEEWQNEIDKRLNEIVKQQEELKKKTEDLDFGKADKFMPEIDTFLRMTRPDEQEKEIFRNLVIPGNVNMVYTFFDTFDGWTAGAIGGTKTPALGGANLATGATLNNYSTVNAEITGTNNKLNFNTKNPFFQCQLELSATAAQTIYFGAGDLNIGDGTEEGFGFKITNGTLVALVTQSDGATATETTATISGITLTNSNIYRADMRSGRGVWFYVNGRLSAVIRTGLPNGTDGPVLMSFHIKTTAAANKIMYLTNALFMQDL